MFHYVAYSENKKIFTLYPAHSSAGRGNLVLKYSVPHFLPNCGRTQRRACPRHQSEEMEIYI